MSNAYFAGNLAYLEALASPSMTAPPPVADLPASCLSLVAQVAVLHLIEAWRTHGFHNADLDPLRLHEPRHLVELDPAHHGLTAADLDSHFETGNLAGGQGTDTLRGILARLQMAYGGRLSAELAHVSDPKRRTWLQHRLEGACPMPLTATEQRDLLLHLTAAETLERLIHTRFVGQKRFSLEGGESLLPLLHEIVASAAKAGVAEIGLGMSHRGRLNVLQNLLGRSVFDLFRSAHDDAPEDGRGGDVKYHQGFTAQVTGAGGTVRVALSFNPSHLEIVSPVVEGWVRARQEALDDRDRNRALAVVVHGDAAFAGQGVVMETLAMAATRGFTTGGTLHIVLNNQIGFTTSDPRDTRSSLYCTDVVKMVEAPILHVNGDDPEAVLRAGRIALEYRMAFHADIAINLICYRRLGHNEQDEPMVTQPLMYRAIRALPSTREGYAQRLLERGVLQTMSEAEALIEVYKAGLDAAPDEKPVRAVNQWDAFMRQSWRAAAVTAVADAALAAVGAHLTAPPPEGFVLHPRVLAIQAARRQMMAGAQPLDWGMGELLAYGSLLAEGYSVRLSGQDSERGTFAHRHAVLHDQQRTQRDRGEWIPLQAAGGGTARFAVVNSLLSEEAVLAFEYGYASVASADSLVLWEAQFGDFVNGAQVVIDQFIASGETKWGRLNGLVLLLPHGYEGQGPEHSSARIERFLQLAAEDNMQIVQPSLPAQFFHLLRRQMVRPYRKPLIVLTPKSLLRHPEAVSPLSALTEGAFRPVIFDVADLDAEEVRRVVWCSGRVYFDLVAARQARGIRDIAVLRIEQFYPFPDEEFRAAVARYPAGIEMLWAQDEPKNQGAWPYMLRQFLRFELPWRYAGRPHSASPATGFSAEHKRQLEALIADALD
ncbi:MAG: 2-oxoglutarate dehydrogenase E1 component [Betaproteobacteria bacterium]|nr:MAG: 2-oxoglutarate dehydrogenase E1 component [Betaproteobacteria bacterium]